jgi:NAD-dependent dihydropyrimidine dehydrogenase PreA subunit
VPPVIDIGKCTGCGLCEDSCPIDVLYLDPDKKVAYVRYPDECWHCGSCRQECPAGCLEIKFPLRILFCSGAVPF